MTFRSEPLRRLVANLPCQRCGVHGETQAAHGNEGKGKAIKVSDARSAALCRCCHREIDQGAGLTRYERRAEMDRAIVLTLVALIERGELVVRGE